MTDWEHRPTPGLGPWLGAGLLVMVGVASALWAAGAIGWALTVTCAAGVAAVAVIATAMHRRR